MDDLAQIYAQSLFAVANEANKLDPIREELGQITAAIKDSSDLKTFFFSPFFSTDEKKAAFAGTFEGADQSILNFLELLVDNHRLPVIFQIEQRFDELWRNANQLISVELTSATPLDPATAQSVGEQIGKSTNRKVELSTKVDPSILGGVVLRVGNAILDASIKNRLEQFRKAVVKA